MLRFVYLPSFATWLLVHIDEYTAELVRLFYEADLPLLQSLKHLSEAERFQFSKRLNIEFLDNLSRNNAAGHLETITSRWLSGTFENIGKLDVNSRDITIINYVRSKAQKKFINQYTLDPELAYGLHSEIDELSFAFNTASINDYLKVLKGKIESEMHFSRNIIEASPGIVFMYDLEQQKEIYINGRVEEVTGYTPEEVLAETNVLLKYTFPDDAPVIKEFFRSLKLDRKGQTYNIDYRFKLKNGELCWMRCYAVVAGRKPNGLPEKVLGTAYNVSREKEMALELQRSIEQLQEFATIASHDLKEPLRKIGLFANMIQAVDGHRLPQTTLVNLQKISDACIQMQKLIEGVLSYSAVNAQLQKEAVSLEALLQEAIANLEHKIMETGALITSDGLPVANVVPLQMQLLFQNLLANALTFTRKNIPPEVRVTHSFRQAGVTKVKNLHSAKQYLEIQVADNGIGFNTESAEKIFGMFQRLHSRSDFEGSGIGLAICKRIVENHGGVISASSEPGCGTVFTMLIPVHGS